MNSDNFCKLQAITGIIAHQYGGMSSQVISTDESTEPAPILITVREAKDKWRGKDVTVRETHNHGVITVDGVLYHITDLPPPKPKKTKSKFNQAATRNQRKRASRKLRGK